jgi:hypothetical protein
MDKKTLPGPGPGNCSPAILKNFGGAGLVPAFLRTTGTKNQFCKLLEL